MLKLKEMKSTPSLPSLLGSLWPGVVAPDRVPFMDQIELNGIYAKLFAVEPFWHLTVNKNYSYTKLSCLKFNSALNDPKRVDTP